MPRAWRAQRARDKARIEATGQDFYEVMGERQLLAQKRRILKQWTPALEAKSIQLFNEGKSSGDAVRILVKENLYDPTVYAKGTPREKLDNRGINEIFDDLREGIVVHPENQEKITFTEIKKGSPAKYMLESELLARDKKI